MKSMISCRRSPLSWATICNDRAQADNSWLQLLCGNNKLKKCLHKYVYVRNIRESGYLYTTQDWDCFLTWNVNSCVGSISPLLAFLSASSRFFWSSSSFVTILRLRTLEILFFIFSRFPVSDTIHTAFATAGKFHWQLNQAKIVWLKAQQLSRNVRTGLTLTWSLQRLGH